MHRCGFEPDISLSTLAMLTSIEVRLEECLTAVAALPPAQVSTAWLASHMPVTGSLAVARSKAPPDLLCSALPYSALRGFSSAVWQVNMSPALQAKEPVWTSNSCSAI
jgi:hypothetical protein